MNLEDDLMNAVMVAIGLRLSLRSEVAGDVPARENAELVCEWLVGYLDRPIPNVVQQRSVIVGDEKLLVSVDAIYDHWSAYIKSTKLPLSKHRIGMALRSLSRGVETVGTDVGTKRYHVLRTELLFSWVESNGLGDVERLRSVVNTPLAAPIS